MIIKSLLMVLSFFILCILVFGFEKFYKDYIVYLLTFGIVIGQVMFPVWFFQGMERMKYTTYLNILAKSIFTIAIFIFVKEKSDYYIVPLLTSIGYIISGALSLYIIKKEFGISFKFQSYNTIKKYLIDGWHVFISRFYVSIYTTTNTVVLGLFTNNTIVGYYSIADKIVMAIGGLFEPANQAIYPYLSRLYNNSFEYFVDFLKKISIIFITISLVIFICSELLHNLIIYLIAGKHSTQISSILVILLIRVVTSPFGSLFSNALIIMQMKKEFLKVMNYTVVLDLLIVIPSTYYNGLIGLAYSFTLIIVLHVMLLLYYLNKSIISTRNQRLI